jgi:CheY-like chemotaxis protein
MGGSDLGHRRVLVAEDQFLVAFDLAESLRDWGCVVLGPAASNAEALELLRREQPDAALLDATLTDGWVTPVAETLAATGVPFALLTGYDGADLPEPVLRAAPRLLKPWTPATLRQLLDRLLAAVPLPAHPLNEASAPLIAR